MCSNFQLGKEKECGQTKKRRIQCATTSNQEKKMWCTTTCIRVITLGNS